MGIDLSAVGQVRLHHLEGDIGQQPLGDQVRRLALPLGPEEAARLISAADRRKKRYP